MSWEDDYHLYVVHHLRTGNRETRMQIWVGNGRGYPEFSRTICLKDCWWHTNPVGERIRRMTERAQRKADELNHDQMYVNHDVEKALPE